MNKLIYKLQISIDTVEGDAEWRDFYLDVNSIYGWYLAHSPITEDPALIVFAGADSFYIKQEPKILKFIKENIMPHE